MLCRQHPQAGCEQDDLAREDAELALTALLGARSAWKANDTDYVSALDVLVLLLERRVGLGFLQLAHDLDSGAFRLACKLSAAATLLTDCRYAQT